jgi:predicted dehydrogenase
MGMAGGGEGAFIGEIHRAAARLDGEVELVCGAFSSNPDISRRTGATLGLAPERVYGSWQEMLTHEAHTYLGYPMVVEARDRISDGAIGAVRKVTLEYAQGWLSGQPEAAGNRQAQWRTDPHRSGQHWVALES